jgi:hypothetical protein
VISAFLINVIAGKLQILHCLIIGAGSSAAKPMENCASPGAKS